MADARAVAVEAPRAPWPAPGSFLYRCGRRWEYVKDVWAVLRPMRFCVGVWAAISLLIILIPQSQDVLLALLEDAVEGSLAGLGNTVAFVALAFLWAFQTFYWARFASRLPPRPRPPYRYPPAVLSETDIEDKNRREPYWLGGVVLVSVWIALVRANWGVPLLPGLGYWLSCVLQEVAITAVMFLLFRAYLLLARNRRALAHAIHEKTGAAAFQMSRTFERDIKRIEFDPVLKRATWKLAVATLVLFVVSGFTDFGLSDLRPVALIITLVWIVFGCWGAGHIDGLPHSTTVVLRLNLILFGLLFLISIAPSIPIIGGLSFLTSAPIIMSVAAAWVFLGTFFFAVPGELLRLPITTIVVVLALIASVSGCRDNHLLRQAHQASDWRSTPLEEAFDRWWNDVGSKMPQPAPLVLVATAGGASRAAYWTAEVLGRLEADYPGFHKRIFAISSVSGGSLGAGVYRAMLNKLGSDGQTTEKNCKDGKITSKTLLDCGRKVIDNDFLGPTFLTGLYADLTQRVLPGALLPDRAAALERSWEQAWHETLRGSTGLDRSFHSLWAGSSWLPALLINGTSEKTGRRIITSNLQIDEQQFPDAIDFFGKVQIKGDIPISTAIHNSARFPYLDAAGTLNLPDVGMTDRIVDGGYFENFGAGSIYDLLTALNRIKKGRSVKFFVLQISSDPEWRDQARRDDSWQRKSPFILNVTADTTAPPVALFNVGSALGFRATEVLRRFVSALQPDGGTYYAHFALSDETEAMSWALSRRSTTALQLEWMTDHNREAQRAVACLIGTAC
jgi:hypothetical protein